MKDSISKMRVQRFVKYDVSDGAHLMVCRVSHS